VAAAADERGGGAGGQQACQHVAGSVAARSSDAALGFVLLAIARSYGDIAARIDVDVQVDVDLDRKLRSQLRGAFLQVGDVEELAVTEDRAAVVVAIRLARVDDGGLTALEIGGLAVDLASVVGFCHASVFTDRRALGFADRVGVIVAAVIFAAHVAVLLAAGFAAAAVVLTVAFGLAVLGAIRAAQPPRALMLDLGALLGATRRAALATARLCRGRALAVALGLQRGHAGCLDGGRFTVRLAIFVAHELAFRVAREKNPTARLEPRLCQRWQEQAGERHT